MFMKEVVFILTQESVYYLIYLTCETTSLKFTGQLRKINCGLSFKITLPEKSGSE